MDKTGRAQEDRVLPFQHCITIMHITQVHPQLRKAVRRVPPLPFHNRPFRAGVNFLLKHMPSVTSARDVRIVDKKLVNAGIRIYRPVGALSGAALLWIHGGGLMMGAASMNDRECVQFARELKLVVISVEYRLAPRYRFPCAIDDCFEAWRWLQENARELGVDPVRVAISGQSAGGGLAASLAQRILDHGGIQPLAQALFCPMLDDRTAARIELDSVRHFIWNNRSNRAGWSSYLGHPAGEPDSRPYAVPARRESLAGLPRAWIGIGDIDLFHSEACQYAARLELAGVSCQLDIVPMAPHGFEILAPGAQLTREFIQDYYRFLRDALS